MKVFGLLLSISSLMVSITIVLKVMSKLAKLRYLSGECITHCPQENLKFKIVFRLLYNGIDTSGFKLRHNCSIRVNDCCIN